MQARAITVGWLGLALIVLQQLSEPSRGRWKAMLRHTNLPSSSGGSSVVGKALGGLGKATGALPSIPNLVTEVPKVITGLPISATAGVDPTATQISTVQA